MNKEEIFNSLKAGLQNNGDFESYLAQTIQFDGRDWTAGQFLYKYYFDEIQPFNATVLQGKVAKEDEFLANKLKGIVEKGLVRPLDVYALSESGKLPDVDMFDGDKEKEAFYQNLFCGGRSVPGNPCYWTPVSQYYTRFIEHRLSQMGMNPDQIKSLMVHCEQEREKAESKAIQNMPEQIIHNSPQPPDKLGKVIQARARTEDNFLNLQKYCFVAEPDTFHSGLPLQAKINSLSWPRFAPKTIAFQLTPEEAKQAFKDSYNYKIDMNQRDSIKPVIPLWGGKPQEWIAKKDLSYHPNVEKETVQDLIAKGMELYLIPNKDDWNQLLAGKDNLSEQAATAYLAELAKRYPDKVIKVGPDFSKKKEDEKSGGHSYEGCSGMLAGGCPRPHIPGPQIKKTNTLSPEAMRYVKSEKEI